MNAATELRMTSEKMPVGKGFAVVFSMAGAQLDVEWLPRVPTGRRGRQCLGSGVGQYDRDGRAGGRLDARAGAWPVGVGRGWHVDVAAHGVPGSGAGDRHRRRRR